MPWSMNFIAMWSGSCFAAGDDDDEAVTHPFVPSVYKLECSQGMWCLSPFYILKTGLAGHSKETQITIHASKVDQLYKN